MEFALVAPIFLAFLLGMIEFSRATWTKQVVQRTAYSTVRCLAIGLVDCQSVDLAKAHAVATAAEGGVAVTESQVDAARGVLCGGIAGQVSVRVTTTFNSPARGFLPGMPETLESTACFPDMSA